MAYWLLKSEPEAFSWDDQVARGHGGEPWTGVRNHLAKNHLKAMAKGDQAFFYHTGKERQIVGIVEIASDPFADPTDTAWTAVTCVAHMQMAKPIGLAQIKADPLLAQMTLVTQPRLSVQPVSTAQWAHVLALGVPRLL